MTEHVMEQPQTGVSTIQPHFSGAILGLQGDVLHGWAMDNAQQEHRPVVEVLIDGASVALVRADQYEPNAPAGDNFHGFAVQLRQRWLDEARLITAKIANQTFVLNGQLSPPVPPSEDSAGIASQVWHTGGLRVAGWCWDPKSPNRHVEVTVREGDRVITKVICDEHNQALAYRASSEHGFSIDLPWDLADGKLHVLEIVNDLGQALAGSPIRLCCWPEGLEGLIQQLDMVHDGATLTLLTEVAREQTLRLPKSAGWQHYPQWFEAFQRLDSQPAPALQGKLGLLVLSDGNTALEQTTLRSLGHCLTGVHKMGTVASSDLMPALIQLLDDGCDRILPMVAGDRLAPSALAHLSALLDDGSAWAYADCDRDGPKGERSLPWLKPVWDIDLFIGADIFSPGAIYSASILKRAMTLLSAKGANRPVNWHDLAAGIALATESSNARVTHLPRVLYHRGLDTTASPDQARPCLKRQQAITWLCQQLAPGATVSQVDDYPALLRAHWPLPEQLPRVSLIVPTRDQYKLLRACIEGLLNDTDYPNLEIIVIDNQSSDPLTLTYLSELSMRGVRVLSHPYPFNYSTINNRAASIATGELIGLVNNDIEIIEASWLREMVSRLQQPKVGAVGAKLLWPNRMVQHGGVVVGINGLAAHTGNLLSDPDAGYLGLNQICRQQSAVTAACLLTKKSTYAALGGLNERDFPVAFNDIDLCLRMRASGYKIIWTPFAKLIHAESASRGKDLSPEKKARAQREQMHFISAWTESGSMDPFYNPSLTLDYLSGPYGGLRMPALSANEARSDVQQIIDYPG
ncbi:glycosyltransferase family 2 protein [Pseudomonas fulva]|uniref:glycosyltransferase family 2 protein n=1 Tax=Pseudomonas fulva TaxID=47880 RepID=UPI0018A9EC3D|nr:glycosyltransferase family 2 protein [Pseudomonas fulva]MBF8680111.1 glycosyltransferase family 2 protein [Pseudomonas fulva]MBF8718545.1 glycosyltransferase family 2 protein [Pseudomonas fulva]MBF8783656.1 glycosyltransferase family 2 protein [Pseudomonas fulva]